MISKVNNKIKYLIALFSIFIAIEISAQPDNPDGPDGGCWPPGATCIPIDGGLSFLIAAGLGLGAKKILDAKKEN